MRRGKQAPRIPCDNCGALTKYCNESAQPRTCSEDCEGIVRAALDAAWCSECGDRRFVWGSGDLVRHWREGLKNATETRCWECIDERTRGDAWVRMWGDEADVRRMAQDVSNCGNVGLPEIRARALKLARMIEARLWNAPGPDAFHPDAMRHDIARALREAFPDRAEAMLSALRLSAFVDLSGDVPVTHASEATTPSPWPTVEVTR